MTAETLRTAADLDAFLDRYESRDLLRFLTCGSVDGGKSTLIGRLLHEAGSIYDDQLSAARDATVRHGTTGEELDYALLLDGLQAEREQGITIDVAYRYFSTPRRSFIIADTPGHEQYTRNMATGASHCDLAVILVDAEEGIRPQTRRHAFIASLLGIRHLVLAVNKLDRVGYSEEAFDAIREAFADFAERLQVPDVHFIPVSALRGDNVVHRSERMPWYEGSTLLDYLETVYIASDRNLVDLRFPVQHVLRPHAGFRGYQGTVASGILRRGTEIVALPSGRESRVAAIHTFDGEIEEAPAGAAVTVTLEDEIDLSRGDMLVRPGNVPAVRHAFESMLVWMDVDPWSPGRELLLKHTTAEAPARVTDLRYRMNVESLHREETERLELNDIARVRVECVRRIAYDAYTANRATGSFILVDRSTHHTVAAGTIVERRPAERVLERHVSADAGSNLRAQAGSVSTIERLARATRPPRTVWLTGLPRAGKSTLAYALERRLFDQGHAVQVLDGENLRLGLSSDLGFSPRDRTENVRRTAALARLLNDQGITVLAALVTPTEADRQIARDLVGEDRYLEVHCSAPLAVCEARDTEGLFARARAGELTNVTGIDAPYETPIDPDLVADTAGEDVETLVGSLEALLE